MTRPPVVACLAYYAEEAAHLDRCVTSLAGVADALVALQGQWDHFPAVDGDDPAIQQAAILDAAMRAGMRCQHSSGSWASQVDKRTQLMRMAAAMGDWLLVIDADEWVTDADGPALHEQLADLGVDVARVNLRLHPIQACSPARAVRRIYRASTGVTVRTAHNGYVTSDGRFLHGDPAYVRLDDAADLSPVIMLGHQVDARAGQRRKARLQYLATRRRLRFESWQQERHAACATL